MRGVRLKGGERIEADAVVAAVDPRHVFGRLIPEDAVPKKLLQRVRGLESSISAMALNLGVNRDLREVGLGAFNIWDYPSIDIDALYDPIFHGRLPDKPGIVISPNSLKDPTGQMAPRGKDIARGHQPRAVFDVRCLGERASPRSVATTSTCSKTGCEISFSSTSIHDCPASSITSS